MVRDGRAGLLSALAIAAIVSGVAAGLAAAMPPAERAEPVLGPLDPLDPAGTAEQPGPAQPLHGAVVEQSLSCAPLSDADLAAVLWARGAPTEARRRGAVIEGDAVWVTAALLRPLGDADDLMTRYGLYRLYREGSKAVVALVPLVEVCALERDPRLYAVTLPSDELVAAARSADPVELARSAREGRCRGLVGNDLNQLLSRRDIPALARNIGLEIHAGRVDVSIWTRVGVDHEAARDLAATYGLEDLRVSTAVSGTGGPYLDGEAPLDRLCALSNDPRIGRIDRPATLVSLG